jgi:AcrR family transcriptional regulator
VTSRSYGRSRASKVGSAHHDLDESAVPVTRVPAVRARAQQDRSQATFEAIRAAAGGLFDEIGIDGTTMDAIARRAGVSIGAVYRFFENRDAIVADIATRWRALIQ